MTVLELALEEVSEREEGTDGLVELRFKLVGAGRGLLDEAEKATVNLFIANVHSLTLTLNLLLHLVNLRDETRQVDVAHSEKANLWLLF